MVISLSKYVNESDDSDILNLKKYNLKKRYDYWNKVAFNNELSSDIPVAFKKIKNAGGQVESVIVFEHSSRKKKIKIVKSCNLYISTNYAFNQIALDKTLIHEMVHVWAITVIKENMNHNNRYVSKCLKIAEHVGFEIPLKEETPTVVAKPKQMYVVGLKNPNEPKWTIVLYKANMFENDIIKLNKLLYRIKRGYQINNKYQLVHGVASISFHNMYRTSRNPDKFKGMQYIEANMFKTIDWIDKHVAVIDDIGEVNS